MASIFQVVKNWFRDRADKAKTAIADPVREGKYAIMDSKALIGKFRSDIATYIASNKGVERDLEKAQADVKKWTVVLERAEAAVAPDDIQVAENELSSAKRRAVEFKKQHAANEAAIAGLRKQLANAEAKIASAEGQHVQLAARQQGVQIRRSLAEASQRFGASSSPLAALDSLEAAVEAQEFEVEAMEEISVSGSEGLANKYSVSAGSVDADYDSMFGGK
jgi:phage shock protein A